MLSWNNAIRFFKSYCELCPNRFETSTVINSSLQSGTFPKPLKVAAIKPLLKKRTLDASMLTNYRPISNLPFIAKIVEKVVFNQLSNFLNSSGLFDKFQSGFRPHHRTEIKVKTWRVRFRTCSMCKVPWDNSVVIWRHTNKDWLMKGRFEIGL